MYIKPLECINCACISSISCHFRPRRPSSSPNSEKKKPKMSVAHEYCTKNRDQEKPKPPPPHGPCNRHLQKPFAPSLLQALPNALGVSEEQNVFLLRLSSL